MEVRCFIVPGAGLEPARPCGRGILSPLRLPVPPPGLTTTLRDLLDQLTADTGINRHRDFAGTRD